MKIYRVARSDMMGCVYEFGFFTDYKEANKVYRKKTNEFRLSNCKYDVDLCLELLGISDPRCESFKENGFLKCVILPFEYLASYEFYDYDVGFERFFIEEIEVVNNI